MIGMPTHVDSNGFALALPAEVLVARQQIRNRLGYVCTDPHRVNRDTAKPLVWSAATDELLEYAARHEGEKDEFLEIMLACKRDHELSDETGKATKHWRAAL